MIVIGAAIVFTIIICDFLAIDGDTAAFYNSYASHLYAVTKHPESVEAEIKTERREVKALVCHNVRSRHGPALLIFDRHEGNFLGCNNAACAQLQNRA
jgi:hypothetical protein